MRYLILFLCLCLVPACAREERLAVMPVVETTPVSNRNDAADDPAIWIHPQDPLRSLVLGTNKQLGLDVYDLQGARLQTLERGRLNNVDLRQGVMWRGALHDIAVATNRSRMSLDIFNIDRTTGEVTYLKEVPLEIPDPYGVCLYKDLHSERLFAFVNDKDGDFQQWWLNPQTGEPQMLRTYKVSSQPEGCVADDRNGILYFGEEDIGIWRIDADPASAINLVPVDRVKNGNLRADIEGMAIFYSNDLEGFLIVSSQGDNSYAVYRREGNNDYLGSFRIIDNPDGGVDGSSETDGLDVTDVPLGDEFPEGMLVVQDGRNTRPAANQNFKYVSWRDIRMILGLE